jgi:regulatory protein
MKSECKYSFQEAKFKLEAFCAYQERCSFEIRTKLASWHFPEALTEKLLLELIESKFLNDARFAEAFVSGKFRFKNWGKNKLKFELTKRRIPKTDITNALKEIDDDAYMDTIQKLISQKLTKLKSQNKLDFQTKGKVIYFLQSKGYELDLIMDNYQQVYNQLY